MGKIRVFITKEHSITLSNRRSTISVKIESMSLSGRYSTVEAKVKLSRIRLISIVYNSFIYTIYSYVVYSCDHLHSIINASRIQRHKNMSH